MPESHVTWLDTGLQLSNLLFPVIWSLETTAVKLQTAFQHIHLYKKVAKKIILHAVYYRNERTHPDSSYFIDIFHGAIINGFQQPQI